MRGSNIVTEFFATAKKLGDGVCFHYKSGDTWNTLTWAEVADLVHQYARGLIAMGVTQGTPVAILSGTRMEWTMIDLAVLAVGGVVVPIYPNLPREHISYILKDSGAHLVVVENDAMLACLREAGDRAASYKVIILQIEGGGHYEGTTTLRSLIERGNEVQTHEIEARAAAVTLDMPASYIYTSGTTGVQKGVIVTHGNIYAVTEGTHDLIDFKSDEICMVCLPLAHVLGRMTQFYLLTKGCQSAYAESIEKLGQNYREVGPHFVVGVPRMLEKALERIESVIERTSPVARKLYYWAKRVAIEVGARREHGEKPRGMLALKYAVANKLVYSKLIDRMGGNLNTFVSGGAPLSFEIARFFTGLGVQVLEGYGLTETFAASTANRRNDFRFGTVGKPVKGVEIKLSGDGEVMIKGPTVFKGYLNKPEATDEAFEGEWFHTGDIGEFDAGRVPADHRPQEGHHRDGGRQEHRAAADRGRHHGEPLHQPRHGLRRQAQVPDRARDAQPGRHQAVCSGGGPDVLAAGGDGGERVGPRTHR